MVYKDLWVVSFPRCTVGPKIVGSCCTVCTPLPTRAQQLSTLLAQQCWELLRSFAHDRYAWFTKTWVVSFPRCTAGPNIVWSCCVRLHTTANTHATTPTIVAANIVGATMLGVVASVCTQPITRLVPSKSVMIKQGASNVGNCFIHILTLN